MAALDLFGTPSCDLEDGAADALVTDEWGGAWLCRAHLGRFLILQASIGRTVGAYLREMA